MRSLVLAALLALPVAAIALPELPEHDEARYYVYVQCERIKVAVAILPGQAPLMVKVSQSRHAEIERQVRYLASRHQVVRITMPDGPECQQT